MHPAQGAFKFRTTRKATKRLGVLEAFHCICPESFENKGLLEGNDFIMRFNPDPYSNVGSEACDVLVQKLGGLPDASRCEHFTLHGSTYSPGNIVAYNEIDDDECSDFNLGRAVALWGDDVESCGMLVGCWWGKWHMNWTKPTWRGLCTQQQNLM